MVFHSMIISLEDSDCDIIMAARKALCISPIECNTCHALGHQDKNKSHKLDRWEILNIKVNATAKRLLGIARRVPQQSVIGLEPWTLWYNQRKLLSIPSTLYDLVHSKEARSYWVKKKQSTSRYYRLGITLGSHRSGL